MNKDEGVCLYYALFMKLWYDLSTIKPFKDTLEIYTMYHLELLLSVYL